ncbi:MAG: response regulator [Proteobacteria bacterium]|nr:MAG: response regulator [Pseudomonadota bacterium]
MHSDFIILSDIVLPRVSGVEHLKKFREAGRTEPFILMSVGVAKLLKDAAQYGVKFFAKPFSLRALVKCLVAL